MSTNFPGSLDNFANPTSGNNLNSPSHSAQHANANDAIEALQSKVGIDDSADATSLDYKLESLLTGWTREQQTVTRVSDHSFTLPFDATSIFKKGTRVRYVDGDGTDYGVVAANSTYSAPDTTIVLAENTDFAMAAGTITSLDYSYAATPPGYPTTFAIASMSWASEGGTITGETVSQASTIEINGNRVTLRSYAVITNVGSGSPSGALLVTPPIAATSWINIFGSGTKRNTSTSLAIAGSTTGTAITIYDYDGTSVLTNGSAILYRVDYAF